jgi:hypothetical protein
MMPEERPAKRSRTALVAAIPAVARAVHASAQEQHSRRPIDRAALAAMVRRGLELLLPGGALATERQRLFNNIAEETWSRELAESWNCEAQEEEDGDAQTGRRAMLGANYVRQASSSAAGYYFAAGANVPADQATPRWIHHASESEPVGEEGGGCGGTGGAGDDDATEQMDSINVDGVDDHEGPTAPMGHDMGRPSDAAGETTLLSQQTTQGQSTQQQQQTPILHYGTAPDDSATVAIMSAGSSANSEEEQSLCCSAPALSGSELRSANASTAPAVKETTTAKTLPSPQELAEGLQNLLGPSYWYCEQIVALLATQAAVPSPPSDLENRRRLCLEMQLHMEFASVPPQSRSTASSAATVPAAAPPALLLLLALQQEQNRLLLVRESSVQSGSTGGVQSRHPAAVEAMAAAAGPGASAADGGGMYAAALDPAARAAPSQSRLSLAAALGLGGVSAPLLARLYSDQTWLAVRTLTSVHGVGLSDAMDMVKATGNRSVRASCHAGAALLQQDLGLSPCQRLALLVRGQQSVPRCCPERMVTEVWRRLLAQCDAPVAVAKQRGATDGDGSRLNLHAFRCSAENSTTGGFEDHKHGREMPKVAAAAALGPRYALVVVLSYTLGAAPLQATGAASGRSGGDGGSMNGRDTCNDIPQHLLRAEVEALVRRMEATTQRKKASLYAKAAAGAAASAPTASAALDAAAAQEGNCRERMDLRVHKMVWESRSGSSAPEGCSCVEQHSERLCVHVELPGGTSGASASSHSLLLDLRVVARQWTRLAQLWHTRGPTQLVRQTLARSRSAAAADDCAHAGCNSGVIATSAARAAAVYDFISAQFRSDKRGLPPSTGVQGGVSQAQACVPAYGDRDGHSGYQFYSNGSIQDDHDDDSACSGYG